MKIFGRELNDYEEPPIIKEPVETEQSIIEDMLDSYDIIGAIECKAGFDPKIARGGSIIREILPSERLSLWSKAIMKLGAKDAEKKPLKLEEDRSLNTVSCKGKCIYLDVPPGHGSSYPACKLLSHIHYADGNIHYSDGWVVFPPKYKQ